MYSLHAYVCYVSIPVLFWIIKHKSIHKYYLILTSFCHCAFFPSVGKKYVCEYVYVCVAPQSFWYSKWVLIVKKGENLHLTYRRGHLSEVSLGIPHLTQLCLSLVTDSNADSFCESQIILENLPTVGQVHPCCHSCFWFLRLSGTGAVGVGGWLAACTSRKY